MNVVSALLHPEEFREILFKRPTNTYRERVGLNLTTTDVYEHTYKLEPAEKVVYDEVELITDGAVLFTSGKAHVTDMSKVDSHMRYQSPHGYEEKN